jgi:glycosyltransferase involved in cell wall biosynthesis
LNPRRKTAIYWRIKPVFLHQAKMNLMRTLRRYVGRAKATPQRIRHRLGTTPMFQAATSTLTLRGWIIPPPRLRVKQITVSLDAVHHTARMVPPDPEQAESMAAHEVERLHYEIELPTPRDTSTLKFFCHADEEDGAGPRAPICFGRRLLEIKRLNRMQRTATNLHYEYRRRRLIEWLRRVFAGNSSGRRLILFTHSFSNSGAPIMLYHLAVALKQRGHALGVICPFEDGPLSNRLRKAGIATLVEPMLESSACPIYEELTRASLVVTNTILTAASAHACKLWKIPVLWWIQDGESGRLHIHFHPEAGKAYQLVDEVVCPSLKTASVYHAVDSRSPVIIPNGIPRVIVSPMTPQRQRTKIRFLQLGTICERKGQDILIAALHLIPKELSTRFHVCIMGHPQQPEFHRTCLKAAKGLDCLSWKPGRAHHGALHALAQADVLIVASRDEALPVVIQEAMSLGKGIVATQAGGTEEFIKDGVHGLLVPTCDPAALATAMEQLIRQPDRLAEYGANAKTRFEEHHDLDRMVDAFESVMNRILSARES